MVPTKGNKHGRRGTGSERLVRNQEKGYSKLASITTEEANKVIPRTHASESKVKIKTRSKSTKSHSQVLENLPPPETLEEKITRLEQALEEASFPVGGYSCVYKLRRYHSEPNLQSFQQHFHHGSTFRRAKTMEDIILSRPNYPSLVTENILQTSQNRKYEISAKMKREWKDIAEMERQRYSFFDELFAKGYVSDSLEVPGRIDDITYLVEADQIALRQKVDYGRIVFKSKTVYTGNMQDWHFRGPGRYIWLDGTIYQGEFMDGLMHGEGVLLLPDGCFFEGEFINGELTGWGIYTTPTGLMYSGEWVRGLPHGQGKVWYNPEIDDCDFYDGFWNGGSMHGMGIRQYSNKDRFIGNFQHGVRKGFGTMIWLSERQVYKGGWINGQPNGFGEHTWYLPRSPTSCYPQRNTYKGDFQNGQRHGIGRMIYAGGSIYDGSWNQNLRHGKGILINPAGEILFAIFRHGSISGGADVPLHVPTYACKFRPLVTTLQQRLHTTDPVVAQLEDEYLSETVTRFLCHIRSLYKRAGYLGEWWGNQGHYPIWLKKRSTARHHLQQRHTKDPIMESIHSQIYNNEDNMEESWVHGHKPHFGSPDHVNPVTRFGLWLLLKDCSGILTDMTLAELDSIWSTVSSISFQTRHHPFEPIQLWQFLQCLVVVASMLYIEIPKRNFQYEANIEENEEPFETDSSKGSIVAEEQDDEGENEAEEEAAEEDLGIPPVVEEVKKRRKRRNSHVSSRKKSTSEQSNIMSDNTNKSSSSKGSYKKEKGRGDGNVKVKSKLRIKKIPTAIVTETQTELSYSVSKEPREAQTDLKYEEEEIRDFMLSEAFELLLVDFLIPCLERRPGKNLPLAPNPMPSLPDLYAAFNVVSPYKDVISAREFLISTLQYRQIPEEGNLIYWTRSRNLVTPDIQMERIFTHFREPSPEKLDILDFEFLGEKLSNVDIFSEEMKTEVFGSGSTGTETKEEKRTSIDIIGSGNIVFGPEFDIEASSEEELKSQNGSKHQVDEIEDDIDNLPLGEHDLTAVPFLWTTEPVCTQTIKNDKIFDNVELSEVLRILRQFYPKTCDSTNVINLEFNLTFGDWLWLTAIITKASTDRAFCSWMKAESALEHMPGPCRQNTRPEPEELVNLFQ